MLEGRTLRNDDVVSSLPALRDGAQLFVFASSASPSSTAAAAPAARQQMPSPDAVAQMMQSPMMSQLLDNPDFMRSILSANPQVDGNARSCVCVVVRLLTRRQQFRAAMANSPELRQLLDSPERLRELSEIMRNPERMRQLQASQDRFDHAQEERELRSHALLPLSRSLMMNIESIPGGFNALRSAYSSVEPMLELSFVRPVCSFVRLFFQRSLQRHESNRNRAKRKRKRRRRVWCESVAAVDLC